MNPTSSNMKNPNPNDITISILKKINILLCFFTNPTINRIIDNKKVNKITIKYKITN